MGATYRRRGKRSFLVTVHWRGEREFKTVHSEQDAKELVRYIHKQELAGLNVVEAIRQARAAREAPAAAALEYPQLRKALALWIEGQVRAGEIRASSAKAYASGLAVWVHPHALPGGGQLGELPVNRVTREMIGAVILRARDSGRSLATIRAICSPLHRYFSEMIETKAIPGPNPAGDLSSPW